MQKDTKIALGFTIAVVGLVFVTTFISSNRNPQTNVGGIVMENGVQIIDIAVKGGYTPSKITATAGVPTELRFNTRGTYDCSSIVAIPSLGYQKTLPATGIESVLLQANQATGTLKGQCGMGMYRFEITFTQ